jgi:hypothetical protein
MPTYIVKLSKDGVDRYFEWSTVVDAPTTYGMALDEFREYYREHYGESGMEQLPGRLARVEKTGCSAYHDSVESLLQGNRCAEWEPKAFPPKPPIVEADGETYQDFSWTLDEIWEFYVERRGDDKDDGTKEPSMSTSIYKTSHFFLRDHDGRRIGVVALRLEGEGELQVRVAVSLCHDNDAWRSSTGVAAARGRLDARNVKRQENVSYKIDDDVDLYDDIFLLLKPHGIEKKDDPNTDGRHTGQIDWLKMQALFERQWKYLTTPKPEAPT